jgi:hypothetical protein
MKNIAFFLEEMSAEEMLKRIIDKRFPNAKPEANKFHITYHSHQGKQDLEKNLECRLKHWKKPNTVFIIIRDQDSENCKTIKNNLRNICAKAGKTDSETIIRIACHELETFYLGDYSAIEKAFKIKNIKKKASSKIFNNPDEKVSQPSKEIAKIVKNYAKINGSRIIAEFLEPNKNKSNSFRVLYKSLEDIFK